MGKTYSPCVGICDYKKDGHCSGCSMTKTQKKISKELKKLKEQQAFIDLIRSQQMILGGYDSWETEHRRRYRKLYR